MSSKFEELQDGEADFMVTYVRERPRKDELDSFDIFVSQRLGHLSVSDNFSSQELEWNEFATSSDKSEKKKKSKKKKQPRSMSTVAESSFSPLSPSKRFSDSLQHRARKTEESLESPLSLAKCDSNFTLEPPISPFSSSSY
jgi:hypothetical protein